MSYRSLTNDFKVLGIFEQTKDIIPKISLVLYVNNEKKSIKVNDNLELLRKFYTPNENFIWLLLDSKKWKLTNEIVGTIEHTIKAGLKRIILLFEIKEINLFDIINDVAVFSHIKGINPILHITTKSNWKYEDLNEIENILIKTNFSIVIHSSDFYSDKSYSILKPSVAFFIGLSALGAEYGFSRICTVD